MEKELKLDLRSGLDNLYGKILLPLRESKEIASVCPTNSVLVLWTTPCQHLDITERKESKGKDKDKAISSQAWTGPEGSRRLRFPDFKIIGT
jgi:hypothetical protein